jgi:hypothetical protein
VSTVPAPRTHRPKMAGKRVPPPVKGSVPVTAATCVATVGGTGPPCPPTVGAVANCVVLLSTAVNGETTIVVEVVAPVVVANGDVVDVGTPDGGGA